MRSYTSLGMAEALPWVCISGVGWNTSWIMSLKDRSDFQRYIMHRIRRECAFSVWSIAMVSVQLARELSVPCPWHLPIFPRSTIEPSQLTSTEIYCPPLLWLLELLSGRMPLTSPLQHVAAL